jgi:hypothetical protein
MARLIDPGQQHPRLEAAMVCAGAATGMALMAAAALRRVAQSWPELHYSGLCFPMTGNPSLSPN